MKIPHLSSLCAVVIAASLLPLSHARADKIDYGDAKPDTLVAMEWGAFGSKDYDHAIAYAQKCITLYKNQAVAQQAALTSMPTGQAPASQWALNAVGISYYIMGMALQAEGKNMPASDAYNFVASALSYSNCYDPKGFYWPIGPAARDKLKTIH